MTIQQIGPTLTVFFPNLDRTFDRFIDYSIDSSYTTSTDGFSFTIFSKDRERLKNLELQPVTLLINGVQQILGRVERTERGNDINAITCFGRDYLSDMVECMVDPTVTVQEGTLLFQAIQRAAAPVGIDEVFDEEDLVMRSLLTGKPIGGSAPNTFRTTVKTRGKKKFREVKLNDFKPNPGEGIFEYLNRLVARHGATIQPANKRNAILIATPHYEQEPSYDAIRKFDSANSRFNNIIQATASRDYSKFPTFTLVKGRAGNGGAKRTDIASLLDINEFTYPLEISNALKGKVIEGRLKAGELKPEEFLYRFHYVEDEQARNADQIEATAQRIISERIKDALNYEVTLRGHNDRLTGKIYTPDTIIRVDDDVCDLHIPLWIEGRTFKYGQGEGATTSLSCWLPKAFQI